MYVLLLSIDCGTPLSRIVGGSEVTPYSIPWHVGLLSHGTDVPSCGGTLIGPRHVLTAAHCVTEGLVDFDVIVGEHVISDSSDGTSHKVCGITHHPDYQKKQDFDYDIAIVRLKSAVNFGSRAAAACLPLSRFKDDYLAGQNLTVSGWGKQAEGGAESDVLNSVEVPALTNSECKEDYEQFPIYYNQRPITNSMICAGQPAGGVDACKGDSGGE